MKAKDKLRKREIERGRKTMDGRREAAKDIEVDREKGKKEGKEGRK